MKIVIDYPPNYREIKAVLNPPITACFAYGDIIYNPSESPIVGDLMVHEEVHEKQMKELGAEAWWDKYLSDKEFRFSQEVDAYAVQYNFVKLSRPERISKRYLEMFAHHLSTIYKLDIDFNKAYTAIRIKARDIAVL